MHHKEQVETIDKDKEPEPGGIREPQRFMEGSLIVMFPLQIQ
jgi:hypothetical protein